jgi:arylsulfatase A-like enzyme
VAVNYPYQIKILLLRLLPLYLVFFILRLLFYLINLDIFTSVPFSRFLADSWYGLRFDSFSICAASSLFILLSALPLKQFYNTGYQRLLKWIYIIPNTIGIMLNAIDLAYFPFTKKRSGADLFKQVGGQTDMGHLLPQYIRDFWWVLLIVVILIMTVLFMYRRIKIQFPTNDNRFKSNIFLTILLFVLVTGFTFLAVRGGLQRIPIDTIDAGSCVPVEEVPIVLNTPFTIIKSLDKNELKELHYYPENELTKYFNPVHKFDSTIFHKKNVVVIILESFGKEYTAAGKTGVSYTPFLDSLAKECFVFTNGFANGSKSIEGIPAVLSGLPQMMENPFINSSYSGNYQTSFATLLGREGYTTAFFHGGVNGTMNFDAWSKLAGYQHYYGKNEYNNNADFDGYWGVWDEPFLQYSIKKMDEMKEPFHSSIFTLSSHHPYFVPKKYEGKFPKGSLDNLASIGYTDYALKLFFEQAKRSNWYKNTLFVLCADHTSLSDHPFYKNVVGHQCIPILFYTPDQSVKGSFNGSFAQVDILPSVMNLLGYNKPFFAFGSSYLNRKNNYCYYYTNGNQMMISDTLVASFNNSNITAIHNFQRDSSLGNNLLGKFPAVEATLQANMKAFMQTYNNSLLHNTHAVK